MVRRILGTLAGVAASTLTIMAVEALGHRLFGVGNDPAKMDLPLLFVLLAWVAGTTVGGFVGVRLSRWKGAPWTVAGLVALGVVAISTAIPTPWWLTAAGIVLPLLIGAAIARSAPAQRVAL